MPNPSKMRTAHEQIGGKQARMRLSRLQNFAGGPGSKPRQRAGASPDAERIYQTRARWNYFSHHHHAGITAIPRKIGSPGADCISHEGTPRVARSKGKASPPSLAGFVRQSRQQGVVDQPERAVAHQPVVDG